MSENIRKTTFKKRHSKNSSTFFNHKRFCILFQGQITFCMQFHTRPADHLSLINVGDLLSVFVSEMEI
mgnify:CR=1 FL=1